MSSPPVKTLIFLLLAAVLLAGCSLKLVYNHLDWVIAEQVDDLIVLNEDQAASFEQRVDYLLAWHRETQLSAYHETLDTVAEHLRRGVDEGDVAFAFAALRTHWQALKEQAAPMIASSLVTLTPEQREELAANLEERNREYQQEHVAISEAERREARIERMQELFEDWAGYTNDQQRNVFAYYAEQFKAIHPLRLEYRRDWQGRLLRILEGPAARNEKLEQLKELLRHPRLYRSAVYAEALEHNRRLGVEMILMLDRTLSAEQRENIIATLRDYQSLFEELAPIQAS